MPPRFTAQATDPNTVVGHLARYDCPTVARIDEHLVILRCRLPYLPTPEADRQHRGDIDALLERRHTLTCREHA